jgi:[protein-PII] uridylyltransferase
MPDVDVRRAVTGDAGLHGKALCRALADASDGWLASLLAAAGGDDMALVAVGGYGRRELCPGSDLDVMLVHGGRRDVAEVADRIWYPIWDAGVGLDHSVRTVKESLRVAESDLKTALGLLDGRFVAGDEAVAAGLIDAAGEQWRRFGRRRLPEMKAATDERHARFGEVAFLLEPDVKEGRGGLRDTHALAAAALVSPVVDAHDAALVEAAEVLLAIRVELHRVTGGHGNVLLLQDQDEVAGAAGYTDADALMAAVAAAGRTIAWLSDDGWRRVESSLAGPQRGRPDRPLGPGLILRDDEVALSSDADVTGDASLALRAGVAAAELGVRITRAALGRLAESTPGPGDPWPEPCRSALVRLLGAGPAAIPILETIDQRGLLVRLLPEWATVRNRPQRNAYHRFTVDRHLWETATGAAALTRDVARPDLLLIGALLHDIGKGVPGRDHTEVGIELVGDIGARMGFVPPDVAVLQQMVRLHLLLPDAAMTRDLDDPRTIELVAEAVGDEETLDLLAALTEADSLATGPSAWSPWKHGLVDDLCARVRVALSGAERPGDGAAVPALPTDEHRTKMAAGVLDLSVEGSTVTVVCPDRPGLFWRVAGTLAVRGVDVRSAQAASEGGMAVEVFEVQPALERLPDWDRVRADLALAVDDRLALEAALAERARVYAPRFKAKAAGPAEPRVLFHDDASEVSTVVEVRAPDGIGVLYRITRALAEVGLDVRTAKVLTLGHEVVDSFYVRDAGGAKVTGDAQRTAIEQAVLAAL